MKTLTRRAALLGGGAIAGGWVVNRHAASTPSLAGTRGLPEALSGTTLNDASELSQTHIFRHTTLTDDPGPALIDAIRAEMSEARAQGRPVALSAARHSMGGQSIPRAGHALTIDNGNVELDTARQTMQVSAGARWAQVIAALDPQGFSPKVMQSNNDFGVASTFCVNAHGWPVKLGPMGATVRNFDLILASGDLVTCSRTENPDLFGMTMGGYGLTGAITRMEVEVAQNQNLDPTYETLPAADFAPRFLDALNDPAVNMAYGRLNVDRASFFENALMITLRPSPDQSDIPAASGSGAVSQLASYLYRAQLGNERLKRFRWWVESTIGPAIAAGPFTRNSLINEPVVTLDDRDPDRTDILHEYFISPARFSDFLQVCRDVIPASYQEFLNVTLRFIDTDPDSWLAYAREPRIAAVMSFSQEKTARAEADMARMTRALIDGVTAIGGTYYLPYRLHATADQFTRAYPRAADFAAAKRALDPDLLFRNALWDTYLETL